jgi:hypothetical protein
MVFYVPVFVASGKTGRVSCCNIQCGLVVFKSMAYERDAIARNAKGGSDLLEDMTKGMSAHIPEAKEEYSASAVEVEISVCSLELQMRGRLLSVTMNPVRLQAVSGSCCSVMDQAPAKSASAQRLT